MLAGEGTASFGSRRNRVGPLGGVFLDLRFREHFAFSPEALVTVKGVKSRGTGGSANISMGYLEFPLLLKVLLPTGRGNTLVSLFAGPAPSIRVSCGATTTGANGFNIGCEQLLLTRAQDLGIMLGGSLGTERFFFSARYDIGLASLSFPAPDAQPVRNRAFSILSGIRVRVGGSR
jgi:hypothetical protein